MVPARGSERVTGVRNRTRGPAFAASVFTSATVALDADAAAEPVARGSGAGFREGSAGVAPDPGASGRNRPGDRP